MPCRCDGVAALMVGRRPGISTKISLFPVIPSHKVRENK